MRSKIEVGSRVVYHGVWPWHNYYGVVIAEGMHADCGLLPEKPSWLIRWEGDQYYPERAGVESWVGKYCEGGYLESVGGVN